MRRLAAFVALAVLAMTPGACAKRPEGALRILVIGNSPALRDPYDGPLSRSGEVLAASVAQGLVSFDASGNIVSGLAERWTVTDDGLSYIFRLAAANWPDGHKIRARDVARLLKREISARSRNSLKDSFGAVEDIIPMTDRVLEINLIAPRPDLLSLLAQPQMAIMRSGEGTGPFIAAPAPDGGVKLTRELVSLEDETTTKEELHLGGAPSLAAIRAFAAADADLVLGGTFDDLPLAARVKLPRNSLRFDPASGLFGLIPTRSAGPLGRVEARQLLSQAIDRDSFVAALGVPGLVPRATVLEPGLDGLPAPPAPSWTTIAYSDRIAGLQAQANRLFGKGARPTIRIALPDGPGANMLLRFLQRDWGQLGFTIERTSAGNSADFLLIDEVAPSTSASWFVRHFRCDRALVCDPKADELMDGARQSPVPAQRYALLGEAAALIDGEELFLPITAPVRWSLVSANIQNFAGNRYARHTLSELGSGPST